MFGLFPVRLTYLLLATVGLAAIVLRYPQGQHETGNDSFVFHGLATHLLTDGRLTFVLNPLSYLGLYPLSYPTGSIFLTGNLSAVSGAPLEGCIFLADLLISIVGMLTMFLLARGIVRNVPLAVLSSAIFVMAPSFLVASMWEVPTRITFTALMPLFLWALLRSARASGFLNYGILVLVLLTMMSFHRLAVLMALVLCAFIITMVLVVCLRIARIRLPSLLLRARVRKLFPLTGLFAFSVVFTLTLIGLGVLSEYSQGEIASGTSVQVQALNLGISLTRSAGLLLPFILVGIVSLGRRRNKTFVEPFFLVMTLVFVPTLILRQYTGYYTIAITSPIIAFGVLSVARRFFHTPRARATFLTLALVFAIVGGEFVADYSARLNPPLDSTTYVTALHLREYRESTCITNDGLTGSRLSAISGMPYLPIGGSTTAFQGPEILVFGFISAGHLQIHPVPITQLTLESDSTFTLDDVQAEADWAAILSSDLSPGSSAYSAYAIRYVCELRSLGAQFTAYGNTYSSPFLSQVHDSRYKVFEGDRESVWII